MRLRAFSSSGSDKLLNERGNSGRTTPWLSVVMPFIWVMPALAHVPLFLYLGAAGMVGHFLLIKALELERASVLSPFGYTQLIWVTFFGYLVFGQWPDRHAFIGMAVIVGSGLYVAWGHRAKRNEEPDSAIE